MMIVFLIVMIFIKKKKNDNTTQNDENKVCYSCVELLCEGDTKPETDVNGCAIDYDLTDNIVKEWYKDYGSNYWDSFIEDINFGPQILGGNSAYKSASQYCYKKLGKLPNEVYFNSHKNPEKTFFEKTDKSSLYFTCVYDYVKIENYGKTIPSNPSDGKYKKYECINTDPGNNCENYQFCNYVEDVSTN